MTGIESIAEERQKQLESYTVEFDIMVNSDVERPLTKAASALTIEHGNSLAALFMTPTGWDEHRWLNMMNKPYKERLIIAGALIAAEIDRLDAISNRKCRKCGCTDLDCTQCIAKDGHPCWWVEKDLCSSCSNEV